LPADGMIAAAQKMEFGTSIGSSRSKDTLSFFITKEIAPAAYVPSLNPRSPAVGGGFLG
jgi:hypothetical protein